MLIDMHVHFFPDNVAPKVTQQLARHYGMPVPYRGTVTEYQTLRRRANVDAAVFFTAATKPEQVPPANLWAIQNSKDGLIGFGTLHPDYENIDDEINRLKKAGIKGIKFHPDFQQFFLDEEKALIMYEKLARDFILIFHIGDDQNSSKINYTSPERLAHVLETIPNLKVIAAHMGGYQMWDRALQCLVGKKLYFDTSSCYEFLPSDKFRYMIKEHGYHKILLGSDYPYNDPGRECSCIAKLGLKDNEYTAVIGENAKRLMAELGI
ncbi:putative TIM-barrel fold metal-dependent hydrolase [Desulfohalotomaculum tongense]|uniref:amidohydrolase family protein n=1 Tax=Desulforadius tongensis TaxID=1216062 RepID=UPI00195DFA31|nr:amidohydrolase family protein [Desulforadius tongensis]MBM7854849.1 putative TIM-barrel fold metal-dependent hydrolase [Desulforadius tongensis]